MPPQLVPRPIGNPERDLRELRELTTHIRRSKAGAARELYTIGTALLAIRERELWRPADFRSFNDYLANGADISRSFGYRLMRIAETFDVGLTVRFGVDKLDAAASYFELAPPADPNDPMQTHILVRNRTGQYDHVTAEDASTRQIRDATRLLAARRAPVDARLVELQQGLDAVAATLPRMRGVRHRNRVRVREATDGTVLITLRDVPATALADLGAALLEELARLQGAD